MNESHRKHLKPLADLAIVSESVRYMVERLKATHNAFDAITGGPSVRLIKDMIEKDALRNSLSSPNSALDLVRSQLLFDDMAKGAISSSMMFDEHPASLRAINDIIKPALTTDHPINAMFERLGLTTESRLQNLYEPAGLLIVRDMLARIQSEKAAFTAALTHIRSPWDRIDWERMQRFLDQTIEYAQESAESEGGPNAWDIEAIPEEEQAEFAEAMRPVIEDVEGTALSPDHREEAQARKISAILAYCERIVSKQEQQDRRLEGIDAKLVKAMRPKHPVWIQVLLFILLELVKTIIGDWISSHTSPAIDRVLGLHIEPVSSAKQPSVIRREAAKAIGGIDITSPETRDFRVVIRKSLPVYAIPTASQATVHRLPSGQIVVIVKHQKKWRLVRWFDSESGEFMSGWVRAKYIAKIRT
jgi:hypothetical protein